jgi:hypothetical protein
MFQVQIIPVEKIIPYASLSNEIVSIPWSNLRVYYDFNSFYGSTTEGLTDDRFFLRLNYLNKDKQILDTQTAPLPYVSAASGDWDTPGTWSNNADQVIPNTLSLDGSTIIDWNIVEISHDIDSGDRDISVLGLIQTGGILKMSDPTVTPNEEDNAGQGLIISHYLEIDGVIDLVGESQLVQYEGSIVDADSGGYIERDQQGTANGFNYNYWSSSVGPIGGNSATRGMGIASTNEDHTINGFLNDGTISGSYVDLDFDPAYDAANTVPPPGFVKTISAYWLYKFYGEYDDYYAWEKIDENTDLKAGEGFTMKGTSGAAPIATLQNYVFEGLPNNGDISLPLNKNVTVQNPTGDVERLVGNPYPSAIDATEFILDNMSIADGGNNPTETVFNGALYFWDHFGKEDSHYLADYVGGYATRNLTGGAIAISNDSRINNTSDGGSPAEGTKVPGEYIAVNQGFFVNTTLAGFNNDNGIPISAVDGGTIVFKNSQRVYVPEDASTSLFFKSTKGKTTKTSKVKTNSDAAPVIRLMYDSPLGYHRQIVLGENTNASKGFDLGYDAFLIDINKEDMYWTLNNGKFVIQGVNSFDDTQSFPIELIVKKAGDIALRLDGMENVDSNKSVSIKDNTTGEAFEITNDPFTLHLEPGTYNNRFEVVFQSNESSNTILNTENNNDFSSEILVYFDFESSDLKLVNKNNLHLSNVTIFNILGQNVKSIDLDSFESESISLSLSKGAYIIKLQTEKGIINKKVIIN